MGQALDLIVSPIYVAIASLGFDVSYNHARYGLDGPYAPFADRDATEALAKGELLEPLRALQDHGRKSGESSKGLESTGFEMQALDSWEEKFRERYKIMTVLDIEG